MNMSNFLYNILYSCVQVLLLVWRILSIIYFKFFNASILSSTGGCVENQLDVFFLNGSDIYICAVALLAVDNSFGAADIFSKA